MSVSVGALKEALAEIPDNLPVTVRWIDGGVFYREAEIVSFRERQRDDKLDFVIDVKIR